MGKSTAAHDIGAATATATAALQDDRQATAEPTGRVDVAASVGDAADLARDLYAGAPVPMDDAVAQALTDQRRRAGAGEDRAVAGGTGTWQDTPVAVLRSGEDLTLAVHGKDGWTVVGGRWPSLGVPEMVPSGVRTVLLAGSDARPGQPVDRSRADAIQLVTSDGKGAGAVVGIARDSWVAVPGHGHAKINAALALGGPELLVDTVEDAAGMSVDGYLLVGFDDFKGLVEAAGGLPIVLQAAQQAMWAELPEGEQVLTGPQALALARERQSLPDGDLGRSRHQGQMVLAALALARDRGAEGLPRLMSALSEHVQTDLDARAALVVLGRALVTEPDQVGHDVASGPTGWSADGQSIVRWDESAEALLGDLSDGRLGG